MESDIKAYLQQHKLVYVPIPSEHIKTVHDLLFNNITSNVQNDVVLLYHGVYYKLRGDYDKMEKYYAMASKLGNWIATNNMASHYLGHNDCANAIKYWLQVVDVGYSHVPYNLGLCYDQLQDRTNTIKYYTMAINRGDH